jgi:hypothetical protein
MDRPTAGVRALRFLIAAYRIESDRGERQKKLSALTPHMADKGS